jgi:ppGpp synthetase/RelA/SpoT-type nucleotidyltranferase
MDNYFNRKDVIAAFAESGYMARHVVIDDDVPINSRGYVEADISNDKISITERTK